MLVYPNFLIRKTQAVLILTDNKQGHPGFFIGAYRNLTSVSYHGSPTADGISSIGNLTSRCMQEMIADLKADSARWEADVSRRANPGHSHPIDSQVNYLQGYLQGELPNSSLPYHNPASSSPYQNPVSSSPYTNPVRASSTSNDGQSQGRSPPPTTQSKSYYPPNPLTQGSYNGSYIAHTPPYPPQVSYSGSSQPVVTSSESYTYGAPGYNKYDGRHNGQQNSPRFLGSEYESHNGYPTASSGAPYTTGPPASDSRILDRYAQPPSEFAGYADYAGYDHGQPPLAPGPGRMDPQHPHSRRRDIR